LLIPFSATAAERLDTNKIDQITGLKGTLDKNEGVYKVSAPRADVKVRVDGWMMPPFMGLTSWAAFKAGMHGTMVMGDIVLMQDEVNPVMSAAFENGLQVTALHNHFFFDEPKVFFMHIGGEGNQETLAHGVQAVLDRVKEVRAAQAMPAETFGGSGIPSKSSITAAPLQELLGNKGEAKDGMFKGTFGRTVKMHAGEEAGKAMGVNTWAAFAGADENAIVDGDFVVLEDELQPVLQSLRKSNISIVAIHQHMTHEQPRTIFLHYWGRGAARDLANGVKTALEAAKTSAQLSNP
jgi:hypothetical protein